MTPKMLKAITDLDSSNASIADCIPVVLENKCELGLLDLLADLFNLCLMKTCFSDC